MSGDVFGPGTAGLHVRRRADYHAAFQTGSGGHVAEAVRHAAE